MNSKIIEVYRLMLSDRYGIQEFNGECWVDVCDKEAMYLVRKMTNDRC